MEQRLCNLFVNVTLLSAIFNENINIIDNRFHVVSIRLSGSFICFWYLKNFVKREPLYRHSAGTKSAYSPNASFLFLTASTILSLTCSVRLRALHYSSSFDLRNFMIHLPFKISISLWNHRSKWSNYEIRLKQNCLPLILTTQL